MGLTKKDRQNILMVLMICLSSTYVYLYSIYLSFSNASMLAIYIIMALIVIFLTEENIMYVMFMMLPMRKLIYIGPLNFYNILLGAVLIKSLLKNSKIPQIPFIFAIILASYDSIVSMLSLPSYTVTPYMIKWYFSFFVFLFLLVRFPQEYNYYKGTLYLNIGLLIVGILTLKQYSGYETITGGLREYLAGAGGTMDQNTYSFHCLMGFVSALMIFLDSKQETNLKLYRLVTLSLGIFSLICGMYMVSKGFYVVLITILLLTVLMLWGKVIKYWKYILLGVLLIPVFLNAPRVQMLLSSLIIRFTKATDFNSLTTGRSDLYSYYISALLSSPLKLLFGAGLNTYRLVFNAHNNYITHNTTLELVTAWGLPMAIIVVVIICILSKRNIFSLGKISFFSVLPLITLLLFSQTVSMFWEDASLFYLIFALLFAIKKLPKSQGGVQLYE